VLQNQLSACAAGPSAGVTAYGITFWWSLALTAPALVPALLLGRARASR
jgi:hypothetical protein